MAEVDTSIREGPERYRAIERQVVHSIGQELLERRRTILVADVGLGRVGIIFGIEVYRLDRNNGDWHQLLDRCGGNRRWLQM